MRIDDKSTSKSRCLQHRRKPRKASASFHGRRVIIASGTAISPNGTLDSNPNGTTTWKGVSLFQPFVFGCVCVFFLFGCGQFARGRPLRHHIPNQTISSSPYIRSLAGARSSLTFFKKCSGSSSSRPCDRCNSTMISARVLHRSRGYSFSFSLAVFNWPLLSGPMDVAVASKAILWRVPQ